MAHDERYRELTVSPEGFSRYYTVPRTSDKVSLRIFA